MTIEAKIIADSVTHNAPRLITMQLRYPRFIHAEVMTHRVFSRNASSSRAIPVKRLIEDVIRDTAMPIHWGKNQKGMQANEEHDALVGRPDGSFNLYREDAWRAARDKAVEWARGFDEAGYHKQIVNRLLEPFSHINVLVTATDYANFFWLRRHPDAQPEIKALADAMWEALQGSQPAHLQPGEWHMPYVEYSDRWDVEYIDKGHGDFDIIDHMRPVEDLLKVSVARCARVSYKTHDGKTPDFDADLALFERLVGSAPLHASPAEHQATPDEVVWNEYEMSKPRRPGLSGNLAPGWVQYRKLMPGERCKEYAG